MTKKQAHNKSIKKWSKLVKDLSAIQSKLSELSFIPNNTEECGYCNYHNDCKKCPLCSNIKGSECCTRKDGYNSIGNTVESIDDAYNSTREAIDHATNTLEYIQKVGTKWLKNG